MLPVSSPEAAATGRDGRASTLALSTDRCEARLLRTEIRVRRNGPVPAFIAVNVAGPGVMLGWWRPLKADVSFYLLFTLA